MTEPIINIENVSKRYLIGHQESYLSLRDQLSNIFSFKNKVKKEEFWALRDVSLKIEKGETVGIIGRNGAGKSTLLKILSQITPPTTGKITMRGRAASLLEVGTGFNPELTGRENIYLNGAILGMTRKEIARKFDEIVAFSEIEKFLDTPVKRYSSGMYVRLAFSVAAHLEPEILIVDEVLAVGDSQFQKKCMGKMSEVGQNGRTVIFVSHNMAAVKSLCAKTVFLADGKMVAFGKTDEVIEQYSATISSENNYKISFDDQADKEMQIMEASAEFDKDNQELDSNCQINLEIKVKTRKIIDGAYVTFSILDSFDSVIYWTSDINSTRFNKPEVGEITLNCKCPRRLLTAGRYSIHMAVVSPGKGVIFHDPTKRITFELKEPHDSLLATYGINTPGYIGVPSTWS
jgi:lipopolysaccharide transport system ATP-binding protein